MQFAQEVDQQIVSTLSTQLTWSHVLEILPLKEALQREFYLTMASSNKWSVRTLRKEIDGSLYQRTAIAGKDNEQIHLERNTIPLWSHQRHPVSGTPSPTTETHTLHPSRVRSRSTHPHEFMLSGVEVPHRSQLLSSMAVDKGSKGSTPTPITILCVRIRSIRRRILHLL